YIFSRALFIHKLSMRFYAFSTQTFQTERAHLLQRLNHCYSEHPKLVCCRRTPGITISVFIPRFLGSSENCLKVTFSPKESRPMLLHRRLVRLATTSLAATTKATVGVLFLHLNSRNQTSCTVCNWHKQMVGGIKFRSACMDCGDFTRI